MEKNKDLKQEAQRQNRIVAYWNGEIESAMKREKGYRKKAKEVVKIYEAEKVETSPFNILYSNTETLQSAVYNSLPRPQVSRRFKDKDPLGKVTSQAISRFLEYFIDSNDQDYSNFDEMVETSVLESLVPGRGIIRFKVEKTETEEIEATDGSTAIPAQLQDVTICGEEVPWDRIHFGYAKRWAGTPWISFDHFMTREELELNFGPEWAAKLPLTVANSDSGDDNDEAVERRSVKDAEDVRFAHICEIWDKDEKEVIFICPSYKNSEIKRVSDPLQLSGFFPISRPLHYNRKISSLLPIPLYSFYEEQAKELNRITIRINRIIAALKVRGFYDASLSGIEKVLTADDNTLIPAENVAALQDGRSLEKSIWLMPINELVVVLQQLYLQRDQVKGIIQEISGIADVMRGNTRASETLGAQQLKNQWGGLRLRVMQKRVQVFIRDCLRIAAELGFKHIPQPILAKLINLPIPTQEEQQQAALQYQQQVMLMQQQGQQPPPPPPILSTPPWEAILQLCNQDLLRNFKIDIETDSTVELDQSAEKQEMGEFLNATAQFLNGVFPLVQAEIIPFEVMKSILMTACRRYRFGTEVEEELEKMQPPPPQSQEDPSVKIKAAAEQQKMQMEQQRFQQEQQQKILEFQIDTQLKQQELAVKQAEQQAKLQEIARKEEHAILQHQSKLRQIQMKEAQAAAASKTKEESNASA